MEALISVESRPLLERMIYYRKHEQDSRLRLIFDERRFAERDGPRLGRGHVRSTRAPSRSSRSRRRFRPRVRDRHRAQRRLRRRRGGLRLPRQLDGAAADAGHNLSDVLGLVVAWGGGVLATPSLFAALHLRPEEGVDPRRARSTPCSCWSPSARSVPRRSAGCSIPSPTEGGVVMIVAAVGIVVNGADRAAVRPRARARHQHPRRLPAHGRGRRGLGGGGVRRARDPVDRASNGSIQ